MRHTQNKSQSPKPKSPKPKRAVKPRRKNKFSSFATRRAKRSKDNSSSHPNSGSYYNQGDLADSSQAGESQAAESQAGNGRSARGKLSRGGRSKSGGSAHGKGRRDGGSSFGKHAKNGQSKKNHVAFSKINPALFVKSATEQVVAPEVARHSFADFGLQTLLLDNISKLGFTTPTAIQDKAIPALMQGKDLIGLANTGTGKTAAFLLPLLDQVSKDPAKQIIVIVPTRELAQQIYNDAERFSKGMNLGLALVIGGAKIGPQIRVLKRKAHLVVGTPGRLKDLHQQGSLLLKQFHHVVLDEADRMLDMGFIPDIRFLCKQLPATRQVLLFSATMPPDVQKMALTIQHNPVTVSALKKKSLAITQEVIKVSGNKDKVETLHNLLNKKDCTKVIVFARTRHGVKKLDAQLRDRGFRVSSLHGDKTLAARNKALSDFRAEKVIALVATDIAARGIDIPNISHVINFDVPATMEDYTHRIGRTGRAGSTGIALTFVPA